MRISDWTSDVCSSDLLETAYSVAFAIAWPLGIALFLARDATAAWYGEPELAPVIGVLSLTFVAMPFGTPPLAMMRRAMPFGRLYALGVEIGRASCRERGGQVG